MDGKGFSINFNGEVGKKLSVNSNPIIAIMSLDLFNKGLLSNYQYKDMYIFDKKENLYSDKWILIYEGIIKKWAPDNINIATEGLFSILKSKDVSFYNELINEPSNKKKPLLTFKY